MFLVYFVTAGHFLNMMNNTNAARYGSLRTNNDDVEGNKNQKRDCRVQELWTVINQYQEKRFGHNFGSSPAWKKKDKEEE